MNDDAEAADAGPDAGPKVDTTLEAAAGVIGAATQVGKKVADYFKYADQFVRDRPVISMGIAAGAGFAIGAWVLRSVLERRD